MFKVLFYLAVLVAVGWAAVTVPLGGKTAWEHGLELVHRESAAAKKPAAPPRAPAQVRDGGRAGGATPAKAVPRDTSGSNPPAEDITAADRESLDRLIPR